MLMHVYMWLSGETREPIVSNEFVVTEDLGHQIWVMGTKLTSPTRASSTHF